MKGHQPRKVIDFIQTVEKAVADLTELGNSGALKNPLVIKAIESMTPDFVKRDWLIFMLEPSNNVTPDNHFDMLLTFLKKQEGVLERLEQLKTVEKIEKPGHFDVKNVERIYVSTRMARKGMENMCCVCGDGGHNDKKKNFCKMFWGMKHHAMKAAVKKLGACRRCLVLHDGDGFCKDIYLCRNKVCKRDETPDHHYFLCPAGSSKKSSSEDRSRKVNGGKSKLTEEPENCLSELSPEMSERCRNAFTNNVARRANTSKKPRSSQSFQ